MAQEFLQQKHRSTQTALSISGIDVDVRHETKRILMGKKDHPLLTPSNVDWGKDGSDSRVRRRGACGLLCAEDYRSRPRT